MNKDLKKYEIISLVFLANACAGFFLNNSKITILRIIYDETYVLNVILTVIGLIFFTIKAICKLNISKWKKVLLILAQLIVYFIFWVICGVIYVLFFTADIPLIGY